MNTKRQPRGIPTGGEFAANEHDEAGSALSGGFVESAEQIQERYETDAAETEAVVQRWIDSGVLTKSRGFREGEQTEYGTGDIFIGRTDQGDRMFVEMRVQPPSRGRTSGSMENPNVQVNPWRFSMSGMTIEKGQSEGSSFGQNYEELDRIVPSKDADYTPEEAKELRALWTQNHLNDLNAGTFRQKEIVDAMTPEQKGNALEHYDNVVAHLKSEGAYEDQGYRYGSQWLSRSAPAADFDRALELLSKGKKR